MANRPNRAASRQLRAFIERSGLTKAAFAKGIGVSATALDNYLDAKFVPTLVIRRAIEKFTNGEIEADVWETAEERKHLDAITPFVPVSAEPEKKNGTEG